MKKVDIYTDGACSGNPGVGGWGAVLLYKGLKREISGAEENTTNNRMELLAIIKGLQMLKEPCEVQLYSDSAYSVNAFNQGWLEDWKKNNWRNSQNKDVKNKDLWEELIKLTTTHKVYFNKVKGHADNELNNRCDFLATSAIKELKAKLEPDIPPFDLD